MKQGLTDCECAVLYLLKKPRYLEIEELAQEIPRAIQSLLKKGLIERDGEPLIEETQEEVTDLDKLTTSICELFGIDNRVMNKALKMEEAGPIMPLDEGGLGLMTLIERACAKISAAQETFTDFIRIAQLMKKKNEKG